MTMARAGKGTTLKIGSVLVGERITIGAVEPTADTIDVSNHDGQDYKEFIGGLKDGGEIEVSGNYVAGDAGQQALMSAFDSGIAQSIEIGFPKLSSETSGPKWELTAVITKCSPIGEANVSDQLQFSATLKVSGKPDFTDAVAATTTTTTSA